MEDGTISLWAEDALAVLEHLTQGPQVLVGSSMGGWIALLTARARPQRVAALVGIAAAPDFTVRRWNNLTPAQRDAIEQNGHLKVPSAYGPDPYILTRALFEDGNNNLVLNVAYQHDFPVHLIQGTADPDVPPETVEAIADCLTGDDVEVTLVENGDHRLSRPQDLERLIEIVAALT